MIRFLKYFFAVVLTAFSFIGLSQNEAKKWYFGNYAALDFMSNPPANLANGAMATEEGCAAIADASGNLLFYTNGATIWNQSHLVMANGTGLFGDVSSSQSALIVKKPGSSTVYFVFTTDAATNGLCYSIVDMSLAAGMGSVTVKNTFVYGPCTERLAGTKHCNGTDTWVISHEKNTDVYHSVLVTAAGVSSSMVLSTIGSPMFGVNSVGCMKVSPNGKKLGTAFYASSYFELYDFNTASGVVSNPLNLPVAGTSPYGCEFSPDGTKFYGSYTGHWCQWNLCAGSDQAIAASAATVNSLPATGHPGQMQLGPDGKIYLARAEQKSIKSGEVTVIVLQGEPLLGVIHNPNAAAAINYNNAGQPINPAVSVFGLPNFVSGFYKTPVAEFTYTVNPALSCVKAFFTAPPLINATCSATSYTISSVKWLFGDPPSGAANTSTLINPNHAYPGNGTYNVRLILYNACGGPIDTLKQQVYVSAALINDPSTFSICAGQSLTLAASGSTTYSWSTGATTSSIVVTPTANTVYSVSNVDVFGCLHSSVQTITVNPLPPVSISGRDTICEGNSTILTAGGGVIYNWSTGATSSTISVAPPVTTVYTLTGTSINNCSASPMHTIVVKPSPPVTISGNTAICLYASATLIASGNGTHLWTDGTLGATLIASPQPSMNAYSVKVTYANGCIRYKGGIYNFLPLPPQFSVAGVNTVCAGSAATQTASGATSYSWSNGVTTNPASLVTYSNTTYSVMVTGANGCVRTRTVLITVKPTPTLTISNATVCSGNTATLGISSTVAGATYTWLPDASHGTLISVSPVASQIYTVLASLNTCTNSATGSVIVSATPSLEVSPDIRIIPGASATLHVSGSTAYTWAPADYLSCADCEAPVATPAESIRYCVSSLVSGCLSQGCVSVTVSCETDHDFSVPNAFTPNGDNTNDEFCLQGWQECITNFNVMIYDRWGEKVYESGDPSFCWDGYYKGQLLNSGVFVYVISAKRFNSKTPLIRKGNISLLR